MTRREILLAIAVAIVWGFNFVPMRWGVGEVPPLLLTALRYIFAAVPAVFFVPRPKIAWGLVVSYGMAIGVFQFGTLFLALRMGMPAGLASLVIQMQAFFTVVFAVIFFGERLRTTQIIGGGIAFVGIAVIGAEWLGSTALLPLLMTLFAALAWAVGNIIGKRANTPDMFGVVVWSSLVPPVPLLILSLIVEGPGAYGSALSNLTWLGGGSILFMAYAATIFGYGVWGRLLAHHPASLVAPFSLLVPITGMAAAALLLGETISPLEIGGSVLVLAGLVLNTFGPRLLSRLRAT